MELVKDAEKCIGCEKEFSHEEMDEFFNDEPTCKTCADVFRKEFKQEGIDNLDEYLEARGLHADFNTFCQAKMNEMTEEQVVDLDENADEAYQRWNLQELKNKSTELLSAINTLADAFEEGDIKQEHYDLITSLQDKYKTK